MLRMQPPRAKGGTDVAACPRGRRNGESPNCAAAETADPSFARFEPRFQKLNEEDARMRTSTVAIWAACALVASPVAFAQQAPEARTERAPSTEAIAVSDAELETFATIYVDLLDTAEKFEAEMKSAQSEEQALAVRQKVETESVAKVAQRGWTPAKFNSVSEAINGSPALTEKVVKLIEAK
jgi:hypothetical protein